MINTKLHRSDTQFFYICVSDLPLSAQFELLNLTRKGYDCMKRHDFKVIQVDYISAMPCMSLPWISFNPRSKRTSRSALSVYERCLTYEDAHSFFAV